jgi:competence protein ComEC
VRHDIPAAFPLFALVCGLAAAPVLVHPRFTIAALLALALLHRKTAALALVAALGVLSGLRVQARTTTERSAFAAIDAETFAVIEAPIDRDWSERDDSWVLVVPRFRANEEEFDAPLSIYARFPPPPIGMVRRVRVEGFLRLTERGQYAVSVKAPDLLAYEGLLPRYAPAAWNRVLAVRLARHAASWPVDVALAQALLLGRGERLDEETRDNFRNGGTYHLLVFSGLQIALAAAILGALLRWLHAPRASDWLLLTFAVIAPLFIGSTPSVARASLGIGLYALSRIARRPTSLQNLWCVAALLRLVLEPRDLTDASFHLTYAGAGALLFLGKRWLTKPFTIELAIAPLTLFHFHQYALGGSLLTIVLSPLIFAMLIASAIACAIPHDLVFATIAVLHRLCGLANGFGFAGAYAAPPAQALVVGALGALLALASLRDRKRAVAIAVCLAIPTAAAIVRSRNAANVPNPRITFFDVGQGDAIAIRSGGQTILVDAGADARIVPLLADRGVRHIDHLLLTHAHPDHCGGVVPVLSQLDVGRLWVSPRRFRGDCARAILGASPPIHLVRDGQRLAIGEVRVTAIVADHRFRRSAENNSSVVLLVEAGRRRALLTGDIEAEAEIVLSDRELHADLLKVPHHGSRSSTTPRLLDAVRPRLAVVSCGRRNLFGHPHPSVLEALAERGIRMRRTDQNGTIDVEITGVRLYVHAPTD